jgi:hypothetical protein
MSGEAKFIRKNGKVIPIRQKSAKKKSGGYAKPLVAAGSATAGIGAFNVAKGMKKAGQNFGHAVRMQGIPSKYSQHKNLARSGAKQMKKGAKQAYAGIAIVGVGALLHNLRKK